MAVGGAFTSESHEVGTMIIPITVENIGVHTWEVTCATSHTIMRTVGSSDLALLLLDSEMGPSVLGHSGLRCPPLSHLSCCHLSGISPGPRTSPILTPAQNPPLPSPEHQTHG